MSDCAYFWELMSYAVDGALTTGEQKKLEAHLALCPECRALLGQMEAMTGRLTEPEAAPAGFVDGVMARVAVTGQEMPFTNLPQDRDIHAGDRTRLKAWWKPIRNWAAVAACCLLLLGAGTMAARMGLIGAGGGSGAAPGAAAPDHTTQNSTAAEDMFQAEPEEMPPAAGEPALEDGVGGSESAAQEQFVVQGEVYHRTEELVEELPEDAVLVGTDEALTENAVYRREEDGWRRWEKE